MKNLIELKNIEDRNLFLRSHNLNNDTKKIEDRNLFLRSHNLNNDIKVPIRAPQFRRLPQEPYSPGHCHLLSGAFNQCQRSRVRVHLEHLKMSNLELDGDFPLVLQFPSP